MFYPAVYLFSGFKCIVDYKNFYFHKIMAISYFNLGWYENYDWCALDQQ